jgi:hypothetical protein
MQRETAGVIAAALTALVSLALFFFAARSLRRKRLIENVPTSKVAGVFIGLTEVKGTAESPSPLRSYLAGIACVYYRYSIEEEWERWETVTDRDEKGNTRTRRVRKSGWTTIASAEERPPFFLRDETGAIRVCPEKAIIEGDCVFSRTCGRMDPLYYGKGPAGGIPDSTGRRSFTEHAIAVGKRLYVIGTARIGEEAVAPEIAYDKESELFLISTRDESRVRRGFAIRAALGHAFGIVFAAAAPIAFEAAQGGDLGRALGPAAPGAALAAGAYAAAMTVHYFILLWNGLVSVRNRVLMAWSQIEIQLKRRYDLIPNLVACVKAFAGHEAHVHAKIAELRASGLVRGGPAPGAAHAAALAAFANGQTGALREIFAVVERYPGLKSDASFRDLMEQLSRTETKISLARTFFNESVTAYNDRIETFPDLVLAKIRGLEPASWLEIEEFERLPVEVKIGAPAP